MARCTYCNSTIFFGGQSIGTLQFCGAACIQKLRLLNAAGELPPGDVASEVHAVFHGACPVCQGEGPVDLFSAHAVYSLLVVSFRSSTQRISCRRCATTWQLNAILTSALLGWWSVRGFIRTPIQIARNIDGLRRRIDPDAPSDALRQAVRLNLIGALGAAAPAIDPKEKMTRLRVALTDTNPAVREQAASALGDLGATARDALDELEQLKQDPDRNVRSRAAWAAAEIRSKVS